MDHLITFWLGKLPNFQHLHLKFVCFAMAYVSS